MVLGNNEPYKVYVQVKTFDLWVCGPEPTGVPCPHEWATVRLCNELSRPNMVFEPMVVPWICCSSHVMGSVENTSRVIQKSHINKILGCRLACILDGLIFLLPYGFGIQWTSPSICASQRSWTVGLWAQTHKPTVSHVHTNRPR